MKNDIPEIKYAEKKPPITVDYILEKLWMKPKKIEEKYKKYAGLNARMFAVTVDSIIVSFPFAPIIDSIVRSLVKFRSVPHEEIATAASSPDNPLEKLISLWVESGTFAAFTLTIFLQTIFFIIFSAICWKIWSTTPGKMLLGMKIVDFNSEEKISNKQITLRCFGYIAASIPFMLGIFAAAFNKERRGWHDKIASTAVIYVKKKRKLDAKEQSQTTS